MISCIKDIEILRCNLATLRTFGIQSLYRGQSNIEWDITCTLRRYQGQNSIVDLWGKYKSAFDIFCTRTEHFDWNKFKPANENDIFYRLAIARHLGFPCNLIDWSSSLDMALLMACRSSTDIDGCLFILVGELNINQSPITVDPLEETNSLIICKDFDYTDHNNLACDFPVARKRRFRQNGFFSLISKNDIASKFENILPEGISMIRIPIHSAAKKDIVNELSKKGITFEWFFMPHAESKALQQIINDIKSNYF